MCDHDWVVIVTARYRLRKRLLTIWGDGKSWGYRACRHCGKTQWKGWMMPSTDTRDWKFCEDRMSTIKGLKEFLVEEAKHAKNQRTQDR